MRSIEQLTLEILALPNESRAMLADKLLESLEFEIDPGIQALWSETAQQRRDDIRNGNVTPISGDAALAQVRQLLEE